MPVLYLYVKISKSATPELKPNCLFLPGLKPDLFEPLQFSDRPKQGRFFFAQVELDNLRTRSLSYVLNGTRNSKGVAILNPFCRKSEIGILKLGVAQTKTKGKENVPFGCVVVAVTNENAFPVLSLIAIGGKKSVGWTVFQLKGIVSANFPDGLTWP